MRVLLQRVKKAQVTVEEEVVGKIKHGLLLFVGLNREDSLDETPWFVNKILGLRVFHDIKQKMNLSVKDVNGELLVVSQFTLYGNCLEGRRPSFTNTAPPEIAEKIYNKFIKELEASIPVQTGRFGAYMQVELINDGPVTFLLER